jgi:formate C-acetyltransferase
MTRIEELKRHYLSGQPELFPERAQLVTESYKETAGQPVVMQRALSLKKILENMTLFIQKGEYFLGIPSPRNRCPVVCPEFGANWIERELDVFPHRQADSIAVTEENKKALRECLDFWKDKSVDGVMGELMPEEAKRAIAHGMITVGGSGTALGNISINNAKLLQKGLKGIIAEIDTQIASFSVTDIHDMSKLHFWKAARIACEAVVGFAARYAAEARRLAKEEADPAWKRELEIMADILDRVPANPAQTFREALQSLWLVYVVLHIESDPHAILLGRFDQYMYPYYKKDIQEGRISDAEVVDLMACLWIKCTSMIKLRDEASSKAFAGFPLFQNITAGGQTPRGDDATNELSFLMLDAVAAAKTSQPSVGLRYHNRIDKEIMVKAAEVIRLGLGYPAIMNDNVIVPKHLIRGATLEEARDYCTNCVETDVPGMTDSRAHSGYVNFPKCLLLAMNDGKDPASGIQIGPQTGSLESFTRFEELFHAYKAQVTFFIETIVKAYDMVDAVHAAIVPEPFMSALLDDCIATGKTRQEGGTRYNFSGIFGVGLSVAADSLAAVKNFVFEERSVTARELLDNLAKDFEGRDDLRVTLLKKAPKYGNNDDYVDELARECADVYVKAVISHPCIRGGKYIPEMHSVATHVLFGEMTGATPDGRKAGETFADGISPMGGRERKGPTEAIQSITKIDHVEVLQGLLYNQKFHPSALDSPEALRKFADYMETYCLLGGHHVQFNIVSREVLLEAQKNPAEFRDLVVRVAGYSAYFTELNERTQNEIISRTEYQEMI